MKPRPQLPDLYKVRDEADRSRPQVPIDYPILDAPNTVLVPHIGFATDEAMNRSAEITFNNIIKWEKGEQGNIVI